MASKYNEQKIYAEIDKLTPDEAYMALQRMKDYVSKKLSSAEEEAAERLEQIQSKINKLNQ